MKLHLIRHGTTTTSGKVFAGRSDVPLNEEGRQMAVRLADDLSARPIVRIVSSPLARCIDTARPLALAKGLEVETDARLLEFDFGVYEGLTKQELCLRLRKTHAYVPVPGGEALIDVWARAGEFLASLSPRQPGGIAVFGHFWVNRLIFGRVKGLDFQTACRLRDYRPQTGTVISLSLNSIKAGRTRDLLDKDVSRMASGIRPVQTETGPGLIYKASRSRG